MIMEKNNRYVSVISNVYYVVVQQNLYENEVEVAWETCDCEKYLKGLHSLNRPH